MTAVAAIAATGMVLLFSSAAQARTQGGGAPLTGHTPLTAPPAAGPNPTPSSSKTARLAAAALTRVGSPYQYAATGPNAFDCSGLVTWAAHRVGIRVPRVSFAEFRIGRRVGREHIRPGDLVFFDTDGPGASDVGIATGPRTEVSATVHGGVMVHPVFDDYWGSHFVGARRISRH
jgi:cell wall-associated NlpC family hydrolase